MQKYIVSALILSTVCLSSPPAAWSEDSEPGPQASRMADDLKPEILGLLADWEGIFQGNPEVLDALARSRRRIEELSAEEVATAAPLFGGRIRDLRRLSRLAASEWKLSFAPVKSTADFPTAPYPNVDWDWLIEAFSSEDDISGSDSGEGNGNCNIANNPSADLLYAFQTIQTTVDAIAAIADRICNQFGSAVIAGANLSSLCIVTDIGAVVAQAFNANWNNCSDWIMAAEVTGSYERLDHVHTDLADAETALTSQIDANEVRIDALDAALVAHDQNLTTRTDGIDQTLDDTAQFLVDFMAERLQLRIEAYLAASDNKAIASFQLPSVHGGYLELVQQIATSAAMSGGKHAQGFLAKADDDFAAGAYKDAFENYGKAYRAAAN